MRVRGVRGVRGVRAVHGRSLEPGAWSQIMNRAFVILFALAVSTASSARAQGIDGDLPGERGTPGWVFTPSVSVGVSCDDNVLLQGTGDDTRSDVMNAVSPRGALDYRTKWTQVSFSYDGTILFYNQLDALNAYDQRATASARRTISKRLSAFAQNNLAISPTTELTEIVGVPFARTGRGSTTGAAGLDLVLTRKSSRCAAAYTFSGWTSTAVADPRPAYIAAAGRPVARRAPWTGGSMSAGGGGLARRLGLPPLHAQRHGGSVRHPERPGVVEWQTRPPVVVERRRRRSYLALPSSLGTKHRPRRARVDPQAHGIRGLHARHDAVVRPGVLVRRQPPQPGSHGSVRVPFAKRRAYVQGSVAWRATSQPALEQDLGLRAFWPT